MQITVLLFASYADTLGTSSIPLELSPGATAGDALDRVRSLAVSVGSAGLPNKPLLAVNERYARPERVLTAGDQVAIIPPVAGG